jgi:outer membrane protein OmpA-like peptidoglycan-associated protein
MRAGLIAAAALAAVLAGCASTNVALLGAEGGGGTGAVAVLDSKTDSDVGVLTVANTGARLGGQTVRAQPVKPEAYASLLSTLPPPAQHFTLYFVEGTTDLTEASKPTFDALRRVVTPGSYVQIIGYTDTVGSAEDNQRLSDLRATEIKKALISLGLPVQDAKTTGRGEHDLAKPTADQVSEPENRRVEVILR